MKKVLITAPYMLREREQVERLFKGKPVELEWVEVRERLEEPDLLRVIGGISGLICGDDRITKKVLDAAGELEVIVKWGTGIDSIDSDEARRRGIPVRRTLDAFSEPVADTTVGIMLAFSRAIFTSDRLMKRGEWGKPQGYCLGEKTTGIIGLGNTGSAVARRLRCFGPEVIANDIRDIDPATIKECGARMVRKDEIYERADFITVHTDLNDTSHHLLDATAFGKMKKRPYVINVARGPVIEEAALIETETARSLEEAAALAGRLV